MESENYHVCIGLLRFCDMKIKCCFEGVYTQERVDVSHEALLQCICWEKFKIFNWIPERTACGTTSPCSVQRIYFVSCFLWIQLKNTNKGLHVPLWQAHIDNKNLIIPICGEASPFRSPFLSSFFFATEFAAPHICAIHLLLSLVRGILFACCLHMVICGVGRGRDSNSISISTCCEKAQQQNIKNKQNIRAQSTYNRGQWTNGHVCTLCTQVKPCYRFPL